MISKQSADSKENEDKITKLIQRFEKSIGNKMICLRKRKSKHSQSIIGVQNSSMKLKNLISTVKVTRNADILHETKDDKSVKDQNLEERSSFNDNEGSSMTIHLPNNHFDIHNTLDDNNGGIHIFK